MRLLQCGVDDLPMHEEIDSVRYPVLVVDLERQTYLFPVMAMLIAS
jgi:hypothetical protein